MDTIEVRGRVRAMFGQVFPNQDIDDNDDIFSRGFVNSLMAMQLVTFVENEFGLLISSDDLNFDNFKSVEAITSFVRKKHKVTQ